VLAAVRQSSVVFLFLLHVCVCFYSQHRVVVSTASSASCAYGQSPRSLIRSYRPRLVAVGWRSKIGAWAVASEIMPSV
jgi:hypothetical protein